MHKFFRGVMVAAMLLAVNAANAAIPQEYKDIVEKAITTNPNVQEKLHQYTASLQTQKAAKSNYYPHADIIYKARKQQEMTANIGNTETPDRQAQFVLNQMLFDGFATSSEVNRLGHTARVRYYELQAAMESVALDMTKNYIDVQRNRALVGFAEHNYVVHKQLFGRIEERVQAGVARKVDMEQAGGRLALAEANLLTEMTNLQNVEARFQNIYGDVPPAGLPELGFDIDADVGIMDANDALTNAYKMNPSFLAAAENILASEQLVSVKRSGYMPKVDLQAKTNPYVSDNGENSSLVADTLELTAQFNLFNGFKDQANIAESAEMLKRSYDLRDKACRDIRQEVSISQNDVVTLKEQVEYRNQHQLAIEHAREAYQKQFDIGQRTLLDLLDTENEYFQARRTYTNTVNDLNYAYARTYAGEGVLLNKVEVVRGDLPEITQSEANQLHAACEGSAPLMINVDKEALLAAAAKLAQDELMKTEEKVVLDDRVEPPVEFETRRAVLNSSSFKVLDKAAQVLKEWGDAKVEVAGHTDRRNTSKAAYNLRLSKKRAQAVADYLVKKGVDKSRLIIKGYGFDNPVAENDPIEGNSANRRVELIRKK